jgi:tRNA(Ile)-lysidine synthase
MKNSVLNQFEQSLFGALLNGDRVRPSQQIIIAVSGGKDSMTLLYSICRIADRLNVRINVVHVNHHLRHNSNNDQILVDKFCTQLKINFILDHLDPATKLKGESPESWARKHRYAVLERIRKEIDADWIFTAHHGNDQIETILFHLSQGTGISGLRGIHDNQGHILRPMLCFSRSDIDQYAAEMNIPWVDDSSNLDESIPRNNLRHNVIKPWERSNPDLVIAFQEFSEHAKDANEALQFAVNLLIPNIIKQKNDNLFNLDGEQLRAIPPLLRTILLRELIGTTEPWRRFIHNGLRTFIANAKIGQIYRLPDNWQLLKDRKQFILKKIKVQQKKPIVVSPDIEVNSGDFIFIWKTDTHLESFSVNRDTELIDANKINCQTLTLRPWLPGDRFHPFGMAGTKKISDYLIDEKVDLYTKGNQWVLVDGERIIWVCGRRINDEVKITDKTTDYAKLIFKQ